MTDERKRARYEAVFAATYGPGPYRCYFCTEMIEDRLDIHHLDHDKTNDVPDNLVPTHRSCHSSYHQKCSWSLGKRTLPDTLVHNTPHTDEAKKKMSDALKGRTIDPDVVAQIAEKNRGKKRSETFRQEASDRAKNRTPEHRAKLAAAQTGKPKSPEARENMRQAALARHARERAERGERVD